MQAVATRRLLQSTSDTAAVVQVQMTGSTENSTAQIAQELGSIVSNNALQVWLAALSHQAHWPQSLMARRSCNASKGWNHWISGSDVEQLYHEVARV